MATHDPGFLPEGPLSAAGYVPESVKGGVDAGGRLTLFALFMESTGSTCQIKVQLCWRDGLYEGVASGPDVPRSRLRLAAAAAVQALEEFTGGAVPLDVEDLQDVTMGPHTVIAVSLLGSGLYGDQRFSGSAVVQRDPLEAVVQAVLDAAYRSPILKASKTDSTA